MMNTRSEDQCNTVLRTCVFIFVVGAGSYTTNMNHNYVPALAPSGVLLTTESKTNVLGGMPLFKRGEKLKTFNQSIPAIKWGVIIGKSWGMETMGPHLF